MTAIVTCGHTRSALATVRALGHHDIPVAVGAMKRPALAQWSAWATSTFLTVDPLLRPEAFAYEIGREVEGRGAFSVMPSTDAALFALSQWREHLPKNIVHQMPSADAVLCAVERYELSQCAQNLGIDCVPTQKLTSQMGTEEVIEVAKRIGFPLVLMPQSRLHANLKANTETSFHFKQPADLRKFWGTSDIGPIDAILQPMLSGSSLGYGAVYKRGEPIAEVFQRRGREHEPASQLACYSQTTTPHLQMRDKARRLLKELDWHGPVKLEFVETYEGHLLLACMLGRLWGSLQLAIHAGVDVPVMWHGLYREKQRHSLLIAQPDMRMRWVMGELSHLVDTFTFQWVRQRGTRGWKKSLENLSKFLHPKDLGSFGTDVLRMGDPLPFAYEVQKTVRKVIKQKADRLIDETSFVRPLSLPTSLKVQSEK